jgi:hypothetical protein
MRETEDIKSAKLSQKDKGFVLMRSIMDYGMGVLWMAMGIFLSFHQWFNTGITFLYDDSSLRIFGFVCIIYGAFRIFRGYKKNYLRER